MGGISLVSSSGMNSWWLLDEWWCCGGWVIGGCCGCVGEWGLMWECQRVVYSAYKPFKKSPWWQNGKKWHFLRRHFNSLRYEVFITTGVSGRENISGNQTWNRFPQALSIYELFFGKVMFESLVPYKCGCASPFSFTRWWIWKIIFPIHKNFFQSTFSLFHLMFEYETLDISL